MPRKSPLATPALLAAALTCLIPLLALAAQQTPPPAPPDALTQEKGLGLTGPANPALPSLILVGDSTVRNGHGKGSDGLWGWGAPIADLFDSDKINVVNRAIGGLSSHTYISQGHWDSTLELIKPGDFVLIQFGHNDGGVNLPGVPPVPDQGLLPGATPPAPPPGATPRPPSGRGSLPGIVLIQTINPDHYAVRMAAAQDYQTFYEKELQFRRMMHYPPFSAMANILVRAEQQEQALRLSTELGHFLMPAPERIKIMGPAEAPVPRLKNEYRYQFLIKAASRKALNGLLRRAQAFARDRKWTATALVIDVDPLTLL